MAPNITLSPQELEDIKDDVKFKTMIVIDVKTLRRGFDDHIKTSDTYRNITNSLKTQVAFQWVIIALVFSSIFFSK